MPGSYLSPAFEDLFPIRSLRKKELEKMFPDNSNPETQVPSDAISSKRLKKRELDRKRYHAKRDGTYVNPGKGRPSEKNFGAGLPGGPQEVIKGGEATVVKGSAGPTPGGVATKSAEVQSAYTNGREAGKHEAITDMITFLKNQLKLCR